MLELLKSFAGPLLLAWPNATIFIFTFIGGAIGFGGAYAAIKGLKDSRGTVTGKIVAEDGSNPSSATLTFQIDQITVLKTSPANDGSFSASLDNGNYSLQIESTGFTEKIINPVDVSRGVTPLNNIALSVASKAVTLQMVDKKGTPYPRLTMALMRGTHPGPPENVTTDNNGIIRLNNVDFGDYNLLLANPTPAAMSFLWATGGNRYSGHFQLKAQQDIYSLILPKVVFHDLSGSNGAPTLVPKNEKYFAQSFTVQSDIEFCGVGFGLGLGGNGTPTTLQVCEDNAGVPGSILFQKNPVPFTGAISSGSEAAYATCEPGAAHKLPRGTYWVVAQYNVTPNAISILGGTPVPANGRPLLASSDGTNWTQATLVSGWNMLDLFLVE